MTDSIGPRTLSPEDIRQIVRERYGAAIRAEEAGEGAGCCEPRTAGEGPGCCDPQEAGEATACCKQQADDEGAACCEARTDVEGPGCCTKSDAPARPGARSSFGCGDPLAMAGIQEGQTVLDVGSGPGHDALAAGHRVGPKGRVIGVDMTEAMLERARRAAAQEGLRHVEFRHGDAERLPVEDASVDWVISNCVVNLVPDKERAFTEIHRVLRPGGRFSITDLIGENLPASILDNAAQYCSCIGGAPSEEDYLQAIRDAGFEDLTIVDRFAWEAPELEGTDGRVWSLKITARKAAA